MHILFLSDNFPPEVNAPASRTFEHCREWAKAGMQVTVITCAPNFPKGELLAGYRNRLWQSETIDGVRVIRVWTYISANEGFLRRTADYVSFMIAASLAAPFVRKVDIVVGTSPQFFTACAARLVAGVKRVPFVFELRDLWPDSIKAVGAMRESWLIGLLHRLELYLYRRAAAIVSVTQSFKRDLVRRGIDGDKIHVVTNGVDVSRFKPMARDAELERELGLEGRFVAGYVGTHGMAHALETLVDAAALLQVTPEGQDIRIVFLGDGARKREVQAYAASKGVDSVIFLDSVPKDQVARYWSVLDVSIVHLRNCALFETVIPSKIFEAMGMGRPMVHGLKGEAAEILEGDEVSLGFEPESAEGLREVLLRLARDPALMERMRDACLAAAPKYDRRTLARRMLDILMEVVGQRAHAACSVRRQRLVQSKARRQQDIR